MPSVDLFIPAAPKDYIKLPYMLRSVADYLPEVRAVHISAPDEIGLPLYRFPIFFHLDRDVLDFDYSRFKFRPTWIYQQFLKLFQGVTEGEWYLCMDADKIINHDLRLFNDLGKPRLFLPQRDQNTGAYYEYSRRMLNIGRVYDHTFLSECTLYNRRLLADMLNCAGLTQAAWLEKSAHIIDALCCPADAELYGNFVAMWHSDIYEYKTIVDEMRGYYNGDWTDAELRHYISDMKARPEVDILSAHSWHD